MILYYAMGGGLGHLTRALAVRHTLGLNDKFAVMAGSHLAQSVSGDLRVIVPPGELSGDPPAMRVWLKDILAELRCTEIYLDAFPAGVLGEWCGLRPPSGVRFFHLARLLKWDEYESRLTGPPPRFTKTYLLEDLTDGHREYLRRFSRDVSCLALMDPPSDLAHEALRVISGLTTGRRPLWLIVHAGDVGEVLELVSYAKDIRELEGRDPALLLISPERPAGLDADVSHFSTYPAWPLFRFARRIFTAAGFNSVRQLRSFGERHWVLPFGRRLDDQFLRARRLRISSFAP